MVPGVSGGPELFTLSLGGDLDQRMASEAEWWRRGDSNS